MTIEVGIETPLAHALNTVIKPKLVEVGWAADNNGDASLAEFIILMLVNGKTQDDITTELAGDLLGLGPDDPTVRDFTRWLFDQIEALNEQINGGPPLPVAQISQNATGPMDQDMDMSMSQDAPEMNVPTGPKSMRNGDVRGGLRGKRMLGQINRSMDRSHDGILHRVRGGTGTERINSHNRTYTTTGPRGGPGRMGTRAMSSRANSIAHGMASQAPGMPGMNGMNDVNWMMQAGPQGNGDLFALLQQQNQMMAALSQQLAQSQGQNHMNNGRGRGKSLFERTQRGGSNNRRGSHHGHVQYGQQSEPSATNGGNAEGEDVDMTQSRQALNPETTVCKFNLSCSNKDCKFAHQSPAAPPGVTIDVTDVCTYGVACKNFKCVGRHPSPATKRLHQSEQECKFFPNCTNPKCPFKHPDMPLCRNGGECQVEGCKFTHVQTRCRFNPCTNRYCTYKHDEGQRGSFHDKVWTANGSKDHVSERKYVDQGEAEELVVPGASQQQESSVMDEGLA